MPSFPGPDLVSLPVSLLVITRNEERHIADCVASASWCDDLLVVDSGSDDRTVELAEEAGARVLVHPFESHALQRNWALDHLKNRWVLCLDADERASPDLESEIKAAMTGPHAAWRIPRRNWLLGDFVRHGSWGRDRVVRFFDKERGRFEVRRIHESVKTSGTLGTFRAPIFHYTVEDLQEYMRRSDTYARLGAQDAADRGQHAGWGTLFVRPAIRFIRSYFLLGGFIDGRRGLIQAWLTAYGAWMKYLYLQEREWSKEEE